MAGIEPDQGLRELPAVKSAQEKTVSFIQDNVLGHASADFQPVDEITLLGDVGIGGLGVEVYAESFERSGA